MSRENEFLRSVAEDVIRRLLRRTAEQAAAAAAAMKLRELEEQLGQILEACEDRRRQDLAGPGV